MNFHLTAEICLIWLWCYLELQKNPQNCCSKRYYFSLQGLISHFFLIFFMWFFFLRLPFLLLDYTLPSHVPSTKSWSQRPSISFSIPSNLSHYLSLNEKFNGNNSPSLHHCNIISSWTGSFILVRDQYIIFSSGWICL